MPVFLNARVIGPDQVFDAPVATDGAWISRIGADAGGAAGTVDCEGDFLTPGIVDIHTDNLEKHFYPRPNIDWDPVSAAIVHDSLCAGVGVTTVFDSLSIGSMGGGEARELANYLRLIDGLEAANDSGALKASHFLHWRCETTSPRMQDLLARLIDRKLTGLLSLMDHTPGQRQYSNLERHLQRWREHLGLSEAEAQARYETLLENQKTWCPQNRAFAAAQAAERGLPLASHDDGEVAHIEEAKACNVTISEFPTTRAAAEAARDAGMTVVMGGPNLMRGGSYSGNVAAADVAEAGLLDAFASDYVPRSLIESAFALTEAPHGWDLPKAIATVTATPADAVGLTDRGRIAEGQRADLLRIALVGGRPILKGVWTAGQRVA